MHAIDGMACAKRGCDSRGTLGLTIVGHGSFPTKWGRRWRYRCTVCGGTVSTHTGTAYSGLRGARRACDQVASLRVEGVSSSATARVTGHSRHTIARWLERASTAAKRFNQRMLRDFEIIELQADELCTFIGNKSRATGLCAAIEVCSRLWAGSVLGRRASRHATAVLNDVILRGRVVGCPLIATDGFEDDVGVSERLVGSACVYGHVLKTRRNDRVVRVARRRRIGPAGRLQAALWESEDSETLHTSFVERLTLTIRQGSAYLRRRSPCHARGADQLHGHVDLLRCSYHVIRPHRALQGIVKLRLTAVLDAQHGGFATGWSPVSWGSIDEIFVNLTMPLFGNNPNKGDLKAQTAVTLLRINHMLRAAGFEWKHVVDGVVYLPDPDMTKLEDMNAVYREVFAKDFPARATVGTGPLGGDTAVEMMFVAVK